MDSKGKKVKEDVAEKLQQPADPFENLHCYSCEEAIAATNVRPYRFNRNTAVMCEMCVEKSMHFRCMSPEESKRWDEDEIWLCTTCNEHYNENGDSPLT